MSMVINLVEDHNIYLCEGGPVYNGGVQPTPITYLTQWRMMGNSVVHTDEYLTQWKVEGNSQIQQYLTQWKVEGNSVVDNNTILSCGDLGQDGKYHVKISNGVNVCDIALDAPLRKVNDVADSIEFANGSAVLTRKIAATKISDNSWSSPGSSQGAALGFYTDVSSKASGYVLLCAGYNTITSGDFYWERPNLSIGSSSTYTHRIYIKDLQYTTLEEFLQGQGNKIILYELETPTTETIQSPQIAVSSTNTYTSVNDTPYSAFTYDNPLIYSCGDYSDVDGKYHVKISNGVTIYDIPLTEPLRKVNNIADTIEFANGVATLTRNIGGVLIKNTTVAKSSTKTPNVWRWALKVGAKVFTTNIINTKYPLNNRTYYCEEGINVDSGGDIQIFDSAYSSADDKQAFIAANADVEIIYELATPTTEVVQVSPFPVSPTDTYTSVNDTPYSAFEYKKNVEIWSCGEYNATDGKYHILVQPLGGSVADIALDEPLRKVNNVADKIEFADGVAVVTRNIGMDDMGNLTFTPRSDIKDGLFIIDLPNRKYTMDSGLLCTKYTQIPSVNSIGSAKNNLQDKECCYFFIADYDRYHERLFAYDTDCIGVTGAQIQTILNGQKIIYELTIPITETIEVPQVQEAESYSCVISQGGKAVSWSSFETE